MTHEEAISVPENPDVDLGVVARVGQDPEYWRKLKPALEMALAALRAQQEPKWISVNDRLPEDGETVLTCKNGIVEVQVYEKKRNGWIKGGWFWSMATVSHWMPLPEPPEDTVNA